MTILKTALLAATVSFGALSAAQAEMKIAFIDPLSGPFGPSGDAALKQWRHAAEEVNANGGINGEQVEIIAFDNKVNPKESLVQLQKAIDQGVRVVAQGNGSSVAAALIDAVNKHNKRNPGEEVIYLNYAAVDPAFTNEACSFWHFRFDANADMKMEALTDWIAAQDDINSVYVIGQDYSFGKAVAAAAVGQLAEKKPDLTIAGNELHPLGKVKDFTPYIQKIISSGADAIITGNWGADMVLLVKAAIDSGWDKPILTYYGGSQGAASAMGDAATGKVMQVSEVDINFDTGNDMQEARIDSFNEQYGPKNTYFYHRAYNAMNFFDMAAEKVGNNDDIVAIAKAMEGMTYDGPYGKVTMRAEDHQVLQDLFITTFVKNPKRTVEELPLGWSMIDPSADRIPADATETETTCEMERPS
ncbi:branched-chain amino acid ABC transporter substrate-binding protein [Aliiroseovarius sp. PTFE2010]|uniref:branched-chain amino acid ABC transporter substrate-binding protein n=1 Tax=Aliiroseovarius sp. PTFE2010 TaxID=3417190 RepID=UPI003CFA3F2E